MSNKIADFFAEIGIKVDATKLEQLDKKMASLEHSLHNLEVVAKKRVKSVTDGFNVQSNAATKASRNEKTLQSEIRKGNQELNKRAEAWKKVGDISAKIQEKNNKAIAAARKGGVEDAFGGKDFLKNRAQRWMKNTPVLAGKNPWNKEFKNSVNNLTPSQNVSYSKRQAELEAAFGKMQQVVSKNATAWNKEFKNAIGKLSPSNSTRAAYKSRQADLESAFKHLRTSADPLKEKIRERLSNRSPLVASKFNNLVLSEARVNREKMEASAAALKDEKARVEYMKKAQQEYAREAARIEKSRVRAAERAEAAAKREEQSARRIEAINKRTAAIKEAGERRAAAIKEAAVIKAQAMERSVSRRVGRPSEGMFRSGLVGGAVGAGMSGLAGILPGAGAGYALVQANKINQEIMGQKMALTSVTGSKEEGEAALQRLKDMANEIGFSWRDTASPFARMIASGKTAGMEQGQVEQIFKSVTEYGRVMGLGSDDMKGSLRAIEQMMNKEQVMAEELKMQLGDRMPAVVGMMAEAVGNAEGRKVSAKELMKMMEEGKVSSKYLIQFAEILSKRARDGGALEAAMNSSIAQQVRFNNQFSTLIEKAGENGMESGFIRIWKELNLALGDVNKSGETLGRMFERFSYIVQGVLGGVRVLGSTLMSLAATLGFSKEAFLLLTGAVGVALLPFGKFALIATAVLMVLDDLSRWANGNDSLFKDLFEGLDPTTQEALTKLSESMKGLLDNLVAVGKISFQGWKELFGWFSEAGGVELVINRITNMTDAISKLLEMIIKMRAGDWEGAMNSANDAAFSSFKASPLGMVMEAGTAERRAALDEYSKGGHVVLPKVLAENKDLTGEQLRERLSALAATNETKNVQFNFGDIKLDISTNSLDPTDLASQHNQVAEWFKGEITKAGMEYSENRQE